jgi:hypothetical protein
MAKKGARKSDGGAARRRNDDQKRAAALKGVVRKTGNCPICHKTVSLDKLPFGHDCR